MFLYISSPFIGQTIKSSVTIKKVIFGLQGKPPYHIPWLIWMNYEIRADSIGPSSHDPSSPQVLARSPFRVDDTFAFFPLIVGFIIVT